jgi:hypothetical protein
MKSDLRSIVIASNRKQRKAQSQAHSKTEYLVSCWGKFLVNSSEIAKK